MLLIEKKCISSVFSDHNNNKKKKQEENTGQAQGHAL